MRERTAHSLRLAFLIVALAPIACLGVSTPGPDTTPRSIETERIRETLRLYAILLDDGRVDEFLDLFTEDAVFTADVFVYEGHDEIRQELADKPRRPGKHLPFPALIELESGTRARAWSDFLRVKIEREDDPTAWAITSIGRYYDVLVKGDDGRWRFQRRDVQLPGLSNRDDLVEPRAP